MKIPSAKCHSQAFEALDCLCLSLLLYMKHGAETDTAGDGEGHFNSGVHALKKDTVQEDGVLHLWKLQT